MARGRNATRTSAIHLRPTAALAERVLLPGDPGRALMLAQSLLAEPRMFNHNRGLWGYTGAAGDGEPLTIQATGMGGPSAAIVLSELISLGVRRAIRVGTCGALDASLGLGELLIASEAICTFACVVQVRSLPVSSLTVMEMRSRGGIRMEFVRWMEFESHSARQSRNVLRNPVGVQNTAAHPPEQHSAWSSRLADPRSRPPARILRAIAKAAPRGHSGDQPSPGESGLYYQPRQRRYSTQSGHAAIGLTAFRIVLPISPPK